MKTEPLHIDGVAGPVVVSTNQFGGGTAITVGGVPAPRTGRRRFALSAAGGGSVEATVRSAFADPYPTVEVNGVAHRTGPAIPVYLRVLAPLPMLLIVVGGILGGLVGAFGLLANMAVARTRNPSTVKAAIMVGVTVAAVVVWFAIAIAVQAAASQS